MVCIAGVLGNKQVALGPLAVEAGIFAFLILVDHLERGRRAVRPARPPTGWCCSASCR